MKSRVTASPMTHSSASPADKPVRVAILGGGAVTWEFYLPALREVSSLELVTVVEPSSEGRSRLSTAGYGGPIESMTAEAFLKDRAQTDRMDAVIVALPNWLHEATVLQALEAGKPVLCEKPLALTEAACRRMAAAEEKSGCRVSVGMVRRRTASVVALREALAADLLGPIERVFIEHGESYQWMSESGAFFHPSSGGVLADMGVHYVDLAQYLFGKLTPVAYEDDWQGGCEANAHLQLKASGGFSIELKFSRDRKLRNRFIIQGKKGTLFLTKDNFESCYWLPAKSTGLRAELREARPFDQSSWKPGFLSAFAQQLSEFAEAVQGRGWRCPTTEEATSVTAIVEWAYAQRSALSPNSQTEPWAGARVFLTGDTGFIGGRLLSRLKDLGVGSCQVPVRNFRSCVEAARFQADLFRLDLLDSESVRKRVEGAKFVFHLAYGRDGEEARKITVQGTQNVVEAAIAAGAEAVVILSTMSVFGHPKTSASVDESWPYAPEGEYGRSKMEMEQWCLKRAQTSPKTRIVLLNPSCVYGPQGKTYTRLPLELALQNQFAWIEGGQGIANYTYVENLVDACLLAATVREAHGKRFLITDGACTWKAFLTPLLGERASELPSFTRSDLAALAGADKANLKDLARAILSSQEVRNVVSRMPVLGAVKRWAGKRFPNLKGKAPAPGARTAAPTVTPPVWLGELFGPTATRFSSASASAVLGWEPKVNLEAGMHLTREWLDSLNLTHSDD